MAKTDLECFFDYARAFELAYLTDDWSVIAPCFAQDARHLVHDGGPFEADDRGRAAVVEGLHQAVAVADRRFDVRIPEIIEGPDCRDDGVWMRFGLTLRRAGLPDLVIEGEHLATYADGKIATLVERLVPGCGERAGSYLARHDAELRRAGGGFVAPTSPHDLRDLELATMRTLTRCYGRAKSHQDVGAALAVCSDDFLLDTVSFGVTANGREEAEQQLAMFFETFPDYGVSVEGMAAEGDSVACWGRARMTFAGPLLGHAPTGRAADLPFVSIFTHAGGSLTGERFVFDAATLCEQIGLPLDELEASLAPLRDAAGASTADDGGTHPVNGGGPAAASLREPSAATEGATS